MQNLSKGLSLNKLSYCLLSTLSLLGSAFCTLHVLTQLIFLTTLHAKQYYNPLLSWGN